MSTEVTASGEAGLRRVLGTWDLVLFNIAAMVALRWLSMAAQVGPSSLTLWLMGLVGFFIPLALAVIELSSRVPGEGGLYLWSKAAFGDMHGFIAGWTYWISNLAYFPSALLFSAGIFLHIGGAAGRPMQAMAITTSCTAWRYCGSLPGWASSASNAPSGCRTSAVSPAGRRRR